MAEQLVERGLSVRVIMPDTPWARKFVAQREAPLRRQRIIAGKDQPFRNEVGIYDDKVMHFSYEEDFAFLIQSRHVADTHRAIFDLPWGSAGLQGKSAL